MNLYNLGVCCWLLFASTVSAQTSLDALLQQALTDHPRLRALAMNEEQEHYRARKSSYPQDPVMQLTGVGSPAVYISLMQKVHIAGKYSLQYEASMHKRNKINSLQADQRKQIVYDLTRWYYKIFALEKMLQFNGEYLQSLQHWSEVQTTGFATGLKDESAWVLTQQELVQRDIEKLHLQRKMHDAQQYLRVLLHNAYRKPLRFLSQTLPPPKLLHSQLELLLENLDQVLAREGWSLPAQRHELQYLQTQADLGKAKYHTQFHLQAGRRIAGSMTQGGPYMVGIGVSVPLWYGKYSHQEKSLSYQVLAHQHTIEDTRMTLKAKVQSLKVSIESLEKVMARQRQSLIPMLIRHAQALRSRYKAGQAALTAVVTSEKDIYKAQKSYYDALQEYVQYIAALEMISGRKIADFSS